MKKKRLFFTIVALALTTATVTACDSTSPTHENMSTPKSGVLSSKSESATLSNSLSEQESKPSHYIVSGGATVQQPFSVNPEFVHIKLLMKNNSSHEVNVSLTHLDTSKLYFARTIAPGESLNWINSKEGFTQGMSTGDYLLQWSGGGYRVEGEVWGSAGSDPDDTVHLTY
ncbi:pilus assembly protein [Paenibacillus sp. FSL H3-0457]|uniref:pilus assembly protein n=1 Tax=Paenibacillus sp. FSL H3-0457 TaxID=2921430 RepID=UPI0030ED045F